MPGSRTPKTKRARLAGLHYGVDSLAALTSEAGETLVSPLNGESITRIKAATNPIAPIWKAISVIPKASSLWRPFMIIAPTTKTAITHQNTGGTLFVANSRRLWRSSSSLSR